jgi:hypothetical protein
MSEVLGDAEPPFNDDDRPPFDTFDDLDGDADGIDGFDNLDGFDGEVEPLRVRRAIAGVATPAALAIAALVVATASLLSLPAVAVTVSSLQLRHFDQTSDALFAERAEAVSQLVVAIVAALLAIAARRVAPPDGDATSPSWVANVSAAAMIVAFTSAVLAITAFGIAATSHLPHGRGQIVEQSATAPSTFHDGTFHHVAAETAVAHGG